MVGDEASLKCVNHSFHLLWPVQPEDVVQVMSAATAAGDDDDDYDGDSDDGDGGDDK